MASSAARSVFRSFSGRNAAARFASQPPKSTGSAPFRLPSRPPRSSAHRIFRSPSELSACLESMQPFHTATASALMTSMLTDSCCGFCWLPEAMSLGSPLLALPSFIYPALTRLDEDEEAPATKMCDELWEAREIVQ